MGFSSSLDPGTGVIRTTGHGSITIDDMRALWVSRLEDQDGLACPHYLADLRGCAVDCTGPELQRLVDAMRPRTPADPQRKVAILVDGPLQYGTSRQFQVFFEGLGTSGIFGDEAEAMAWLQAAAEGSPSAFQALVPAGRQDR